MNHVCRSTSRSRQSDRRRRDRESALQLPLSQGFYKGPPALTPNNDHRPPITLGITYQDATPRKRTLDALSPRAIAVRRREPRQVVVDVGACIAHPAYSFMTDLIS